jgi:hypothetical protein
MSFVQDAERMAENFEGGQNQGQQQQDTSSGQGQQQQQNSSGLGGSGFADTAVDSYVNNGASSVCDRYRCG